MNVRRVSVVFGVVLLVIALPWAVYDHVQHQVDFQFYEPTQLPVGVSIRQKRLDRGGYGGSPVRIELDFRRVDWVYSVDELKATNARHDTMTTLHNYDPTSVGVTCTQRHTASGMSYRLCHWIDYGRINVYQINFVKGGTYVTCQMPNESKTVISVASLDAFVDSFKPASTAGLPVLDAVGP